MQSISSYRRTTPSVVMWYSLLGMMMSSAAHTEFQLLLAVDDAHEAGMLSGKSNKIKFKSKLISRKKHS